MTVQEVMAVLAAKMPKQDGMADLYDTYIEARNGNG